eukprot:GHVU01087719.1.p2 GENE.GHVU01087719.1~~GHVU01087719.1.p2  ORF type:complete len:220 (-),score=39.19 GHVU01087719.1:570-1229(-)
MVKAMTESAKVPHMNIGEEIDVTELLRTRATLKDVALARFGMKLTLTPLLMKATSLALEKVPILNSRLHTALDGYTVYESHNMNIAIDTPSGLAVPVVPDVRRCSIMQLQRHLLELQEKAQSNTLKPEDLSGGTITLSNVGVIGGTYVKPVLFDGQATILAFGRTQLLPRFDAKGQVQPSSIMNVSASVDHRHCDGATVARFINELRYLLENPAALLIS